MSDPPKLRTTTPSGRPIRIRKGDVSPSPENAKRTRARRCGARIYIPSTTGEYASVFTCTRDRHSLGTSPDHVEVGRVRMGDGSVHVYQFRWQALTEREVWRDVAFERPLRLDLPDFFKDATEVRTSLGAPEGELAPSTSSYLEKLDRFNETFGRGIPSAQAHLDRFKSEGRKPQEGDPTLEPSQTEEVKLDSVHDFNPS